MTDQLLSLAREVGAFVYTRFIGSSVSHSIQFIGPQLTAFAERIRQDERERCAKVCEAQWRVTGSVDGMSFYIGTGQCASAIRSSGTSGSKSDE